MLFRMIIPAIIFFVCLTGSVYPAQGALKAFVSILPQKRFVERIGGDRVKVEVMIPPGASPHTYEPTPGKIKALSSADIYIKVGTGIEFEDSWLSKFRSMNRDMTIVDMAEGIQLLEAPGRASFGDEDHKNGNNIHEKDPHVWLSLKRLKPQLLNILKGMIRLRPDNAGYFRDNLNRYLKEIDKASKKIEDMLAGLKSRQFIVFHPSFGYFADDFNLTQIPVEVEGHSPGAKDIKRVIDIAEKRSIKTVFVSPQFPKRSAEVIAGQIGGRVKHLDPLSENYIGNMFSIAESLIEK
jgi:zinc transport system substrate-binding protein